MEGIKAKRGWVDLAPLTMDSAPVAQPHLVLDCFGLLCPVPVRKTAEALEQLRPGQILKVIATDEWFGPDLEAWLKFHPHELMACEPVGTEIHAYLKKGPGLPAPLSRQAGRPGTLSDPIGG